MDELNPNKNVFGNDIAIWEKGQHGGRTRPIDLEVLYKTMLDFVNVLEKHNIKYCISHGTMLGLYRDKNFIPYDDDVDIALLDFTQKKLFETECRKDLEAMGFYMPPEGDPTKPVKATGLDANMPYYDGVGIRDGEKIECWWFEHKGDFYIYDEPRCGNDLKHEAKYYDELQDYEWRGKKWKIPNHIEDYLVMMYGKSWPIPKVGRKYNNQGKPNIYGD